MERVRKLHECDPSDPLRCQGAGTGGEGQCRFLSIKGMYRDGLIEGGVASDYDGAYNCPSHGGQSSMASAASKRVHDYRLQVWQNRLDELSESDSVKTLRGEIGILRIVAEQIMNQCRTHHDLLIHSSRIADLMSRIEKLVVSCSKLEDRSGYTLDRQRGLVLAMRIVEVINVHVDDPSILERISDDIYGAFKEVLTDGNTQL